MSAFTYKSKLLSYSKIKKAHGLCAFFARLKKQVLRFEDIYKTGIKY